MPDWLTQLRTGLLLISSQAAQKHWPGLPPDSEPYYNYRFEHVLQVERDAARLMATVRGDEDIVLASVWIHDRFKPQYEGERHAARAAEWAHEHLAALGFPVHKVPAVEYAVANHSNAPQTIPAKAVEARIVWDVDKLSKVGVSTIVTLLCGNPAFPQTRVSHQRVWQRLGEESQAAEMLVSQFYFEPSRQWARARLAAQKAFYEALGQEMNLAGSLPVSRVE